MHSNMKPRARLECAPETGGFSSGVLGWIDAEFVGVFAASLREERIFNYSLFNHLRLRARKSRYLVLIPILFSMSHLVFIPGFLSGNISFSFGVSVFAQHAYAGACFTLSRLTGGTWVSAVITHSLWNFMISGADIVGLVMIYLRGS